MVRPSSPSRSATGFHLLSNPDSKPSTNPKPNLNADPCPNHNPNPNRWRYGDSWPHWLIVGCMSAILLAFAALVLREWCLNRGQKQNATKTEASTLLAK